jgi:CspA family cold shock protein
MCIFVAHATGVPSRPAAKIGDKMIRQIGTVKFFNEQKGFGFIKPDDGGNDIFVHITALQQSGLQNLAEGMRISFETEPDKRGKGPKAVQLRPE